MAAVSLADPRSDPACYGPRRGPEASAYHPASPGAPPRGARSCRYNPPHSRRRQRPAGPPWRRSDDGLWRTEAAVSGVSFSSETRFGLVSSMAQGLLRIAPPDDVMKRGRAETAPNTRQSAHTASTLRAIRFDGRQFIERCLLPQQARKAHSPPPSMFSGVKKREGSTMVFGTLSPASSFRAVSMACPPPVGYSKQTSRIPSRTYCNPSSASRRSPQSAFHFPGPQPSPPARRGGQRNSCGIGEIDLVGNAPARIPFPLASGSSHCISASNTTSTGLPSMPLAKCTSSILAGCAGHQTFQFDNLSTLLRASATQRPAASPMILLSAPINFV